jgi:hypothetical protein
MGTDLAQDTVGGERALDGRQVLGREPTIGAFGVVHPYCRTAVAFKCRDHGFISYGGSSSPVYATSASMPYFFSAEQ